ncbi:MAG: ribosomal protein S18-alanine N-acetyltransferase [Desulfobacterales bacterium]|jgi:ribosomal-protein-alanine acetyltransferase
MDECQIVTINKSVDLDPILAIEQLSFQYPWRRRSFEGELSCPSGLSYVVKSAQTDKGAQIVAYAFLRRVLEELHLLKIAVAPARRGRGIANWFLNHCFTMGAQQGAKSVYLEVRLSNITAIKLYEKLGFRVIGHRSNYYPDSKEDAVVMMKDIEMNMPKGTNKGRIKKNVYSFGSN